MKKTKVYLTVDCNGDYRLWAKRPRWSIVMESYASPLDGHLTLVCHSHAKKYLGIKHHLHKDSREILTTTMTFNNWKEER